MSNSESEFDCPVCYQLPKKEVYQCQDGHILCHICITKVTTCPQCRVKLGKVKIRNRMVESLLDKKVYPCEYKDVGCEGTPMRQELKSHHLHCKYGYRLREICSYVGFTCNYNSNLLKPQEFLKHFQEKHGILIKEIKKEVVFNLKTFNDASSHSQSFWTPVILKLGKNIEAPKILIVVRIEDFDKSFWIGCNLLEDPLKQLGASYTIAFSIQTNSSNVVNIEWTLNPNCFDFAARVGRLLQFPVFRIPISTLKSYYVVDDSIKMNINVISREETGKKKKARLSVPTLDLFPIKKKSEHQGGMFDLKCTDCQFDQDAQIWYKCLQCHHILCPGCMKQKKHSHHVFAMLKGDNQQNYFGMVAISNCYKWDAILPEGWNIPEKPSKPISPFSSECNNCGRYPIDKMMYTCLLCPTKADFCQTCVEKKDIHGRHILGVILSVEQEDFINSQRKPGSPLVPLFANKVSLESTLLVE